MSTHAVNHLLAEAATDHTIDLQQYARGLLMKMVGALNRVDADLMTQLTLVLQRLPATSFTVVRLRAMLSVVKSLNKEIYARIGEQLVEKSKELAEYEAEYQLQLFTKVIPPTIQLKFQVAQIPLKQLYAAVASRPMQGELLSKWASKLEADRLQVIENAVRMGYLEGQPVADIVRKIQGSKEYRFADGALDRPRRDLAAVVRTAVNHTAAVAQSEFFKANAELIDKVKWFSRLDSKTSPPCIARADRLYTAVTHKPIDHEMPWGAGPGRYHWQCRSKELPITRSWKALGFDTDQLPPGERASMDGAVPADTTYAEWLTRQSAFRQDQILGPTRGQLLREGKVSVDSFYTERGAWLTLEQLRARDAAAFKRAGL